MKILCQFYHVSYYSVCAISFSLSHSASSPVAGPGARKPSVGEGKESSQPLVCSALVYFLFFSFFFISAPILACEIIIIIIIIILYCRTNIHEKRVRLPDQYPLRNVKWCAFSRHVANIYQALPLLYCRKTRSNIDWR